MNRAGPPGRSGGGAGGVARGGGVGDELPTPRAALTLAGAGVGAGANEEALAGVVCTWTTVARGAIAGAGGALLAVATAPPTTEKAMAPAAILAARGEARSAWLPRRVTTRARQRWAQRPSAGTSPTTASLSSPVRARKRVRNDLRARCRVTSTA